MFKQLKLTPWRSWLMYKPLFAILISILLSCHAGADTLDDKLQAQWQRFDLARQILLERVGCKPDTDVKPIDRAEWEAIIAAHLLSSEDINSLNARQLSLITKARAEAQQKSVIDFNKLKKDPNKTAEFCARVPKGGMLHVHPDGTIDARTALRILQEGDPLIKRDEIINSVSSPSARFKSCEIDLLKTLPKERRYSKLSPNSRVLIGELALLPSKTQQDFIEFEAKFSYIGALAMGLKPEYDAEARYLQDFLDRSQRQGVSYVEFTTGCPSNADALKKRSAKYRSLSTAAGINTAINCSFSRVIDPKIAAAQARDLFSLLLGFPATGTDAANIRGIDLLGDEEDAHNPNLDVTALGSQRVYACYLEKRAQGLNLQATIHAGEFGDPHNPRDALIMGAARLGHGVLLRNDPVALEFARLHHIPVETNLVSNLRLGAVADLGSHPYLDFLRLGLPVSLSTDDEGILDTTISNECAQAILHTDITYFEFRQMAENSIRQAFVNEAERASLLSRLNADFDRFERGWLSRKTRKANTHQSPNAKLSGFQPKNPCCD